MTTTRTSVRLAALLGVVAAATLGTAPAAMAAGSQAESDGTMQPMNWTSSMSGVQTGFQSRRWSDESYSQIWFTGCVQSRTGGTPSTDVDLRQDITAQPDVSWGVKHYTQCFEGTNSQSSGEWHNLDPGQQFFQIKKIDDALEGPTLGVRVVTIDTTAADQN